MRSILLNPGPVSLSEGVRRAATSVDLCHREPEYFAVQDRVRSALIDVYDLGSTAWTCVLLGGSGTSAMEAMLASLVPQQGRLLVLENGVYGERLSQIASIYHLNHQAISCAWTEAWDLAQVEALLAANSFTHVAAVHHETTTGRLNDVAGLAELCERHGTHLLLDAVSSFGAESIPFDSPALAACAATANKCLHGMPGLCFVVVRRPLLGMAVEPPRSLTLNLALWAQHQDQQSTPFTPAVNGLLALDRALQELVEEGGWTARHARYHHLAERVARQLSRLDVQPLLPESAASCVLRAYTLPAGRSYPEVHDVLKLRGFVIYAGQGQLEQDIFRISTMGDITNYDMERLMTALDMAFS